jgi:YggT family protein
MSFLGYTIIAVAKVFGLIINLYTFIVVIAALISWVNPDPYNPIVRILHSLTQPAFRLVRRAFPGPLRRMRIDLSPIVVILVLVILETALVGTLLSLGRNMLGPQ